MPPPSALSFDIWENIAYYTLTGVDAFLGPPSGLSALCLISRYVYNAIHFDTNSRLYARLFRFKFDYVASCRRLSIRWRNTRCLALEFKKRIAALERIRNRQQLHVDDLWTCYLMYVSHSLRVHSSSLTVGCWKMTVAMKDSLLNGLMSINISTGSPLFVLKPAEQTPRPGSTIARSLL